MNNYVIKGGTTDVSVVIRIIDSTDGTPETGVVFNTSGIDLEYRREGATSTDITEATLASLSTAHADGGFLHIGNGYYRLDLPDAAVAAGSASVPMGCLVHGTVTGMVVIGAYIQIVAYDPFETVRLGLTALPNAAAEAAGGLYTRGTGAGQINQPANGQIDVNVERWNATALAAEATAGIPDVNVKNIDNDAASASGTVTFPNATLASTTNITAGTITTVTNLTNAPTNGDLTTTMKASVNTEVDTAIADARLDELLAADSDIDGAAPPTVGSVFHELMSKTTGSFTYDQTTDSNEAIRDNMGTAQTGDSFARLGAPAGASVSADIAAIEAQTDDIGTAGAGLTAIPWNAAWDAEVESEATDALNAYDPPTFAELDARTDAIEADTNDIQTRLPAALVSGRMDSSVGAMAANTLTASALASDAIDEIWDEAMTELSAVPGVTASMRDALRWIFLLSRNKINQTATTQSLRNDADSSTIATSTVSDDGTTFIRNEFS